jgi:cystathionine beta-synthase
MEKNILPSTSSELPYTTNFGYKTLLNTIGSTPIIKVDLGTPPTILAKLEYLNPGGSLKDRSSLYMIEEAERKGILKAGGTIIDASSGNQGIATAMIGAFKGYKVIISVSEKISQEKKATLEAYGAEVVTCPVTNYLEDPKSYHSVAMRIHKETPNSFMPDQYFNVSNAHAHYHLLGPEVWQQTHGTVTHYFGAAGTGGNISGVGAYLKEKNSAIKIIALDSDTSWHATKGNPKPYKLEGMGIDFESPVLNKKVIDEIITVSDENAIQMLKYLAKKKGLLVGPSAGATAYAVKKYSENLPMEAVVVMVLGDSGRAYLTKNFY